MLCVTIDLMTLAMDDAGVCGVALVDNTVFVFLLWDVLVKCAVVALVWGIILYGHSNFTYNIRLWLDLSSRC